MRGQILDTNGLEAYVALDDDRIISVPIYKTGNSNIGDYIYVPDSATESSNNFRTAEYINPIIRFF